MSDMPYWDQIIFWSDAISVANLNTDRSVIPDQPGFYTFTPDITPLKIGKVLYIGETKNLRNRLPNYLHHDPTQTHSRHKGALFIMDHRLTKSGDKNIFLRWSLFESDYTLRRDVEAAMIQFYFSWYNDRDRGRDHPFED